MDRIQFFESLQDLFSCITKYLFVHIFLHGSYRKYRGEFVFPYTSTSIPYILTNVNMLVPSFGGENLEPPEII